MALWYSKYLIIDSTEQAAAAASVRHVLVYWASPGSVQTSSLAAFSCSSLQRRPGLFSSPHFTAWSWNKYQEQSKLPVSLGLSVPLLPLVRGLLSTHESRTAPHHSVRNCHCRTVAAFATAPVLQGDAFFIFYVFYKYKGDHFAPSHFLIRVV